MKLVLDTNVVLDWLHFRDPRFGPIAQAIEAGRLEAVTSAACLAELRAVLCYAQFRLDAASQAALLERYAARSRLHEGFEDQSDLARLPRCHDSDDQKFLRLAWQAGAQVLLTRDKALLKLSAAAKRQGGFAVMAPERLVESLNLIDLNNEN